MILALVAALGLSAPAPAPTPEAFGETAFYFGVCSAAGWGLDEPAAIALGEAASAADPMDEESYARAIVAGSESAAARFQARFTAIATQADLRAFAAEIQARCDGLAEAHPHALWRADDTQARFDADMDRIAQRLPQ